MLPDTFIIKLYYRHAEEGLTKGDSHTRVNVVRILVNVFDLKNKAIPPVFNSVVDLS